jgi:hypothetical protein
VRATVGILAQHGVGAQAHQLLDGAAGAGLGAFLQELAQQDEGDDHRGGLEVHVGIQPAAGPERGIGGVEHAEDVGHAGAEGHQRVHVGAAVLGLLPGVDEEGRPKNSTTGVLSSPHHEVGPGLVHHEHADDHQRDAQLRWRPTSACFKAGHACALDLLQVGSGLVLVADQQVVADALHHRAHAAIRRSRRARTPPARCWWPGSRRRSARRAGPAACSPRCSRSWRRSCPKRGRCASGWAHRTRCRGWPSPHVHDRNGLHRACVLSITALRLLASSSTCVPLPPAVPGHRRATAAQGLVHDQRAVLAVHVYIVMGKVCIGSGQAPDSSPQRHGGHGGSSCSWHSKVQECYHQRERLPDIGNSGRRAFGSNRSASRRLAFHLLCVLCASVVKHSASPHLVQLLTALRLPIRLKAVDIMPVSAEARRVGLRTFVACSPSWT